MVAVEHGGWKRDEDQPHIPETAREGIDRTAASGFGRPAGNTLWQLFGTSNQLLAGLGLLVVSVYLHQLRKPVVYTLLPMAAMFVSVGWAMTYKLGQFYAGWREHGDTGNGSLLIVGSVLLLMAGWMVVEAGLAFGKSAALRRVREVQTAGSGSM